MERRNTPLTPSENLCKQLHFNSNENLYFKGCIACEPAKVNSIPSNINTCPFCGCSCENKSLEWPSIPLS